MSARPFTELQPLDGETILHCGHRHKHGHFFAPIVREANEEAKRTASDFGRATEP